jgi:pimeloyl-ACP methyl ester carboxylesterase
MQLPLHYTDRGRGAPLLLLHGGLGIGDDWRHVFPVDPPGLRVIVPDLRGHGHSWHEHATFSIRECAHDVLALLDALGIARVRAIGLSLGAKTLLHVATAQPDRVEAMVLVSATPRFPKTMRDAAAQLTDAAFDALAEDEKRALFVRHVHGEAQVRWLYSAMRSLGESADDMAFTAETLAAITARTLIVHGDRDPLYAVELAVELFRGIPQSSLRVVPNGGHGPIFGLAAPAFAAAAIANLLGTVPSP